VIRRFFRRRPSWYEDASAYLDGELRGPARTAFERELARSAPLRDYLADLRAAKRAVAALPPVQLPRSFTISTAQARGASRTPRLERRAAAPARGGGWFEGAALVRSVAAFSVVAVAALAAVITVDVAGDNGQGPRQSEAEQAPADEDLATTALAQTSADTAEQTSTVAASQAARFQDDSASDAEQAMEQAESVTALAALAPEESAPESPAAEAATAPESGVDVADDQAGADQETPLPEPDGTGAISAGSPPSAVETDTTDESVTDTDIAIAAPADADAGDAEATGPTQEPQDEPGVATDDSAVAAAPEVPPSEEPAPETSQVPSEPERATAGGLADESDAGAGEADEESAPTGGATASAPSDQSAADSADATERAELQTEQAVLVDDGADDTTAQSVAAAAPETPDVAPAAALLDADDGDDMLLIALEVAFGVLVGLSLATLFVVLRRRA